MQTKKRTKEKKLSDCMQDILNLKAKGEELEFLESLGIKKRDSYNKMVIAMRIFEKAAKGDIQAIKELRSIASDTEKTDIGRLAEIIEAVSNVS